VIGAVGAGVKDSRKDEQLHEKSLLPLELRRGAMDRRSFLTELSLALGFFLSPPAIAKTPSSSRRIWKSGWGPLLAEARMISEIKALTFDVGGTVLDWHRGLSRAFTDAGSRLGLKADWPAITNEYRRRSLQAMVGRVNPSFNNDDVHHTVLEAVLKEHGLEAITPEERAAIWRTWHQLDAWPDFAPALARLRERYAVVAFTILSTSLILDVSRHNRLTWDCIVSCEMIGIYKTRPEAYQTCAKWLGHQPGELVMVACHDSDLMAAREAGYRTAFVARPAEWGAADPPDQIPNPAHDIVVTDFGQLATRFGA
jgi:2-haloacid dehalogenase